MFSTIEGMKCFNKKKELLNSLQIFQKGILMSITSIKALQKIMEEKFGYKYILTHRGNQDCLENFYSQVRGRNGPSDHPTPVECLNNIKYIILGKNPGLSCQMHSNTVERDPEEYVSASFNKFLSEKKSIKNGLTRSNASSGIIPHNQDDVSEEHVREEYLTEEFLDDNLDDVPTEFLEADSDHLPEAYRDEEYLNEEFLDDNLDEVPTELLEADSDHLPEEYLDEEYLTEDGNLDGKSDHVLEEYLTIEFLDGNLDDVPEEFFHDEYLTKEFLQDLSNEMKFDEYGARTTRSTEDGLGTFNFILSFKFKIIKMFASI